MAPLGFNTPSKYFVGVTTILDKVLARSHIGEVLEEQDCAPKEGKRQLLKSGVQFRGGDCAGSYIVALSFGCNRHNLLERVEGGRRSVGSFEFGKGMD